MNNIVIAALTIGLLVIQGCSVESGERQSLLLSDKTTTTKQYHDLNVAWASNVGGPQYQGRDGIMYQADPQGTVATHPVIESIKGAQDATVYQTYRAGDMHFKQPLPNGDYDITFRFAEPNDLAVGERVFDVLAEGQVVIPKLDVKSARDGNSKSSVDRTVLNVELDDGVLDIQLKSIVGKAILSGIVVRAKKTADISRWSMVWSDEFDYTGPPDPSKWNYDVWPAGKVNDEEQAYTNRPKNVRVDNGMLTIEAHREDYESAQYTSARVHAQGKGDFMYGRIAVRAKLPSGQGTWPAIWMLPSDPFRYATTCSQGEWQGNPNCDAWPNSGELDIMEHVGYDMNRVHGTVHNRAYYWVNGEQRKASVEARQVDTEFHVYAMEWSAERIDVFYDDALYFTYLNQGEGWEAWPYDSPFHLILNVAVAGGWGGAGGPTDVSAFPTAMQVDYVRLYQSSNLDSRKIKTKTKMESENEFSSK